MASALADSNVHPHDRFFFSDGSLFLLVENTLYRVHKFLFEIHATMSPVRELETSLSKPYVLGDVKKSDFDCLLASLYPRTLWVEETEATQDWISVLGLACKWGFESLRSRAISKIEQTLESPIDMVILGRQYGIPDVLLPGYAILCQSTIPLSYEEGLRLGMEDVVNIYRIRHELYGSGVTPVPLEVAFAKVKEAGLGAEEPRQELDDEEASTWTDVGSVAALPKSAENDEERGSVTLTPNVDSPPLDVASTDAVTLVFERPEQQNVDAYLSGDEPTSALDASGLQIPPVCHTAPDPIPPVCNTAPGPIPPVCNTAPAPIPPVCNTAPAPIPPVCNTAPAPIPPVCNTAPDPIPPVCNTAPDPIPPVCNTAPDPIPFTFNENAKTQTGENIFVTGNLKELGNWNPKKAIPLNTNSYPTWSATVNLPANITFKYKYIRIFKGRVTWESDPNRQATTPRSGSFVKNDSWR